MEFTSEQIEETLKTRGYTKTSIITSETFGQTISFMKTLTNGFIKAIVYVKRLNIELSIPAGNFFVEVHSTFPFEVDDAKFRQVEEELLRIKNLIDSDKKLSFVTPIEKTEKPKADLYQSQKDFWQQIKQFCNEKSYPEDLAKEFYRYWSEPNKSRTKMKKDLEQTFDISRRIGTWIRNDRKWSRTLKNAIAEEQNQELKKTGEKIIKKDNLF